jgi:hypothetical protein
MTNNRHPDRDAVQKAGLWARARGFSHRIVRGKGEREKKRDESVVPTDALPIVSSAGPSLPVPGRTSDVASVNSSRGSGRAANHEYSYSDSDQSLWDRAYEALGNQYPDLVKKYQKLLGDEARKMGTRHLHVAKCLN